MNIQERFIQVLNQRCDRNAIRYKDQEITYRDLDEMSSSLAAYLKKSGVLPSDVVAILLNRSFELIISMLAILKCGAIYLPLDKAESLARNKDLIELAEAKVIIGDSNIEEIFSSYCKVVSVENSEIFFKRIDGFVVYPSGPNDPAYLMFTSGTTSKPKGVLIPHRGVVRLVTNTNYINIRHSDKILQFSSPSFDASTFEIWGSLLNGACLILYSELYVDLNCLKEHIINNKVSIMWLSSAIFHLVADKRSDILCGIDTLLAGGDVLNPKYVKKVLTEFPSIKLINGYGPTENTTFTCCHVINLHNVPDKIVPIGKPISGTEVFLVDDQNVKVKDGDIGELLTTGTGLALGYIKGNPKEEKSFFYDDTLSDNLIYRTGDFARKNIRGEYEFIGRKDNQVKIRGYRISLDEIRAMVMELEGVNESIALKECTDSGDELLTVYFDLCDGDTTSTEQLFEQLRTKLPRYMVPDKFIQNSKLNVNKNGKIDKSALLGKC